MHFNKTILFKGIYGWEWKVQLLNSFFSLNTAEINFDDKA